MKKYEIKLNIVTPCIISGNNKQLAEMRAPSIRGQLRHWFRVNGGTREEELNLFGGINGDGGRASKVIVRVTTPNEKIQTEVSDGKGISGNKFDYFLWPLRSPKNNPQAGLRGYIKPNQVINLTIIDKADSESFEKCLKSFLYLGALGSRSRRGYGSIFPTEVSCNGSKWELPKTSSEMVEEVKHLSAVTILSLADNCQDYKQAIKHCVTFLKSFRCGSNKSGTPSKWGLNDHDIRYQSNDKTYRAVIGLPLTQRYSDGNKYNSTICSTGGDRWASPICFKVVKLGADYIPLAIFLKDYFIPEETDIRVTSGGAGTNVNVSHEMIEVMMDPEHSYHLSNTSKVLL